MFEDIPVEVGVVFEGERIRWRDAQVELGGPRQTNKFELVKVRTLDEIEDGKVTIVGPDLTPLAPDQYKGISGVRICDVPLRIGNERLCIGHQTGSSIW